MSEPTQPDGISSASRMKGDSEVLEGEMGNHVCSQPRVVFEWKMLLISCFLWIVRKTCHRYPDTLSRRVHPFPELAGFLHSARVFTWQAKGCHVFPTGVLSQLVLMILLRISLHSGQQNSFIFYSSPCKKIMEKYVFSMRSLFLVSQQHPMN